MAEVLLRDLNGHATCDRMARVRMPHPVRAGLRKALGSLPIAVPSQYAGTARKKRLDLIVERRRRNPFAGIDQLARVQARRTYGGIAGLAKQKRPLIADVLRIGIEPTRFQVLCQLAHGVASPSLSLGSATANEINNLERCFRAYGTTFL